MKENLKKYWYVGLISLIFIVGIIAVVVSSQEGKISTKKVDGKDVVFSINGINRTADELYENEGSRYEAALSALIFEREVLERTYEYSEDQRTEAKLEADQTMAYYKSYYGEDVAQEIIEQQLQAMGYPADSGLVDYYLNASAILKLEDDYFLSTYKDKFIEEEEPLLASHILVMFSDDTSLSEEEIEAQAQEEMAAIDVLLETESFEDVAIEHSDDVGSAANGGDLGLVYKSINFYEEFLEGMYKLDENQVSEWIKTPAGYHKMVVTSKDFEDVQVHEEYASVIASLYPQIRGEALFEKAEELKFDFSANPELENQLRSLYSLDAKEVQE